MKRLKLGWYGLKACALVGVAWFKAALADDFPGNFGKTLQRSAIKDFLKTARYVTKIIAMEVIPITTEQIDKIEEVYKEVSEIEV